MVYDNRHRSILQAVMHRGAVLDQDAAELCLKIFDERVNVSTIAALINDKLAPLAMSMKAGICEMTGDKYWSVVGTTHEDAIMIPSEFSISQRAFLRLIYAEIVSADDGCISSTDCLNFTDNLDTKLSKEEADHFLRNAVRKKWLYSKNGFIYMGVRSIVELMPYFRATYQENFHNCYLCKEVLFHGYRCENCDKIFHNYCIAKYIRDQKTNKCPQCKHIFDTNDIPAIASQTMGEEETDEPMDVTEDITQPGSPLLSSTRKLKKRSRLS